MPELPEVETVRRGLASLLPGRVVAKTKTYDSPKSFPNSPDDVGSFLIGASVRAVRRRAKVLMIDLDSDYSLVIHLKMTGQLVFINKKEGYTTSRGPETSQSTAQLSRKVSLQTATGSSHPPLVSEMNSDNALHPLKLGRSSRASQQAESSKTNGPEDDFGVSVDRFGAGHPNDSLVGSLPDRSTRVSIEFQDGSNLYFNDQRKFGWMKLMPTVEIPQIDFMKKVGPEPLEDSFDARQFIERMRRRNNTTIKAALLDQSVLAGIGNIYADEGLWGAKIHPSSRVKQVADSELSLLLDELKTVLLLSIEKGGSTDRNYVDAEGNKGSYIEFARVFRREGQPCRRHPDQLIEKIRVAGRGTHVCPVCQPLLVDQSN